MWNSPPSYWSFPGWKDTWNMRDFLVFQGSTLLLFCPFHPVDANPTWFWTSTLKSISHVNAVEGTQFLRVIRWEEWGFLRGLLWVSVWLLITYTGPSRFMHCLSSALGGWPTWTTSTSSVVTWLPGGCALETPAQDHIREERESQVLLKLMSIELVMPSNHLILCCPLLLLPSIFPSIRFFSNESALHMRWPKYWNFSFNISPSNEHPGLISFRMDWLDLLAVQRISRVVSNTTVHQFFGAQLSSQSNSHIHTWPVEKP